VAQLEVADDEEILERGVFVGRFGPELWGLTRRVSKSIPASAIVDTRVFGKLYANWFGLR
jgi:hypothetical protein